MSISTDKLLDYQQKGFLFHGSPDANILELVPRQAKDIDPKKTFNTDIAVFATSSAKLACIFGVVPQKERRPEESRNESWATSWNEFDVSTRIPRSWKEVVEQNIGYVYVLPSETFLESKNIQYKSKVAVTPVDKIVVSLKDFYEMKGHVQWM